MAASIQIVKEDGRDGTELISVGEPTEKFDESVNQVECEEGADRSLEMNTVSAAMSVMPPSVAEIAAAINEKQKAALQASMAGLKTRPKLAVAALLTSPITSSDCSTSIDVQEKVSGARSARSFSMRPKRVSVIDALRIPTIELKWRKSSSPIEYEHLFMSDVGHGLDGNITHSTMEVEKKDGAGKPVTLIGEDVHGAAAFVRTNAMLHGDEIRSRCIAALNLQSMVCSNLADSHAQNYAMNSGLSMCVKQAAAAFSCCRLHPSQPLCNAPDFS